MSSYTLSHLEQLESEIEKLRSDRHQGRFADSIHEGIRRYFAANPPLARSGTATG